MAVSKSIDISASPERVWQEFADPSRWASWMGRYSRTEPLEGATTLQPGTKVRMYWTERSRDREYGRRTIDREATWEVPAVQTGTMVQMGQPPNFTTWTLEPVAGGTRVSMVAELNSFAAKLFGPITKLFTGAQGSIDLNQLKKKCEESPTV
jgi:uncharacterized protein YndB with AHSA1/START domain